MKNCLFSGSWRLFALTYLFTREMMFWRLATSLPTMSASSGLSFKGRLLLPNRFSDAILLLGCVGKKSQNKDPDV
eukprot:08905.XXX_32280_32504_1 [CDS] Oithona nana genome sequencing.